MVNKKAQSSAEKSIFYLIFGFICTIIFLLLLFIVASQGSAKTVIPKGLETDIIIQRFLNSPNCFIHKDIATDRTFARVIDWNKFSNKSLENCYPIYNSKVVGFRLALLNSELKENKIIETKNWKGYIKEVKREKNIRIYKDAILYNGELKIEIQKK
jgi:hypothetical protein